MASEKDFLACCGSTRFAREMASAAPFTDCAAAVTAARNIWFNKVDVNGWLEAFSAHPQIGHMPSHNHKSPASAQWSKGEQATALATATDSSLQELKEWNARYMEKFGFVFLICASGRSAAEILVELKRRYENRPIIEFEIAAGEQMKITELRLGKLFAAEVDKAPSIAEEDRMNIIGSHLTGRMGRGQSGKLTRVRPPITTHVLDTARGCPATGVEVLLEVWKGNCRPGPHSGEAGDGKGGWNRLGSSATDKDGRSGQVIEMADELEPGVYRISFDTGRYNPDGFFPFVSIVFEVRESQKWEHFHVPLLLSPFSFSTYRGS